MLALEEIRKLSKSLNTSLVKAVGLENSIEDVLNNMIQTKGIEVDFQFNPRVAEKLNDEQQLMLFRIIQEQTSNIIKYADAANVTLLLNETGGNVHLVIRDDGKGFDTKQKSRGIGFVNIFSRVDAYHGKANIISSPGNGCTLEIRIPVK